MKRKLLTEEDLKYQRYISPPTPRSLWSRKLRQFFRRRRREIDRDFVHYRNDNGRLRNKHAQRDTRRAYRNGEIL